ncbi:MAG TPA: farnesyl diphosphate synthase [bacterium]|nr:farnesyl diphosphate synthase [bacterium]
MAPVTDVQLTAYLASRGRLVDDALDHYLPPDSASPSIIHRAMRYAVSAGGKHLRPILVLAGTEACGAAPEPALPVACAVELIHTYSLIHDDLPAMDNSPIRRGRPTCHMVFGDAIAVLAGDALHALAFSLLLHPSDGVAPEQTLAVCREISQAIGTAGMVGGQVLDVLAERRPALDVAEETGRPQTELVREIHLRKTAALIRASVRAGGWLAGADETTLAALGRYGERLGLAYQIVDDILDVEGDAVTMGKRPGGDAAAGKVTYPAAYGVERSRAIASDLTAEAIDALGLLGMRGRTLRELAAYLLERDR